MDGSHNAAPANASADSPAASNKSGGQGADADYAASPRSGRETTSAPVGKTVSVISDGKGYGKGGKNNLMEPEYATLDYHPSVNVISFNLPPGSKNSQSQVHGANGAINMNRPSNGPHVPPETSLSMDSGSGREGPGNNEDGSRQMAVTRYASQPTGAHARMSNNPHNPPVHSYSDAHRHGGGMHGQGARPNALSPSGGSPAMGRLPN